MTLLHIDSCSDRDGKIYASSCPMYWQTIGAQNITGRDGATNGAIQTFTNGSTNLVPQAALIGEHVLGCAMKWAGVASTSTAFVILDQEPAGSTQHLTLNFDATKHLTLRRGTNAGTIIATSSQVLTEGIWNFWEIKVLIDDTVGKLIVKVDGDVWINYTGDTRNAGLAQIGRFTWTRPNASGSEIYVDDVYCLSTTGAAPFNDFLGDVMVARLVPNNNGAANALVGSDGNSVDNYALVDELSVSLSDYVESLTPGAQDIYQLQDLSTSTLIYAVEISAYAAKTDAGTRAMKIIDRQTGNRVGSSLPLSVTPQEFIQAPTLIDADGNQWTTAKVNSMQVGIEVA